MSSRVVVAGVGMIPFAKPGAADRGEILRLSCLRVPLASDVDIDEFAAQLEGSTGADIESLCKKATLLAISKYQGAAQANPFVVRRSDFESVLDSHRGSITPLKDPAARPGTAGEFTLAARIHL